MPKNTKRRAVPAAAPSSAARSDAGPRLYEREFNPDYSYVVKDLRRIAILAGSFFVVLLALTFILN